MLLFYFYWRLNWESSLLYNLESFYPKLLSKAILNILNQWVARNYLKIFLLLIFANMTTCFNYIFLTILRLSIFSHVNYLHFIFVLLSVRCSFIIECRDCLYSVILCLVYVMWFLSPSLVLIFLVFFMIVPHPKIVKIFYVNFKLLQPVELDNTCFDPIEKQYTLSSAYLLWTKNLKHYFQFFPELHILAL